MPSDDFYADDASDGEALPDRWAPIQAGDAIPEVAVNSTDLPPGLERQPLPPVDEATLKGWTNDIKLPLPPPPDLSGLPALSTYFDADAPPLPADGSLLGPEARNPRHPLSAIQMMGGKFPDRQGGPGDKEACIERCSDLVEDMPQAGGYSTEQRNRCIQQCMGTGDWDEWRDVWDPQIIPGIKPQQRWQLPPPSSPRPAAYPPEPLPLTAALIALLLAAAAAP
jgi:hypothetical protein